jgi:PEP-CTERM motif-containing protein
LQRLGTYFILTIVANGRKERGMLFSRMKGVYGRTLLKSQAGALVASFLALSLSQASANPVDTPVGGSLSSPVVVSPNTTEFFDDYIAPGIIFQDSYYFTPSVNSNLSANLTFSYSDITSFSLQLDNTGVNPPTVIAADYNPVSAAGELSLVLSDPTDVLSAGSNYALVINGANETGGLESYIGYFSLTAATPLPATLPLFASGIGALGLFGLRRKRKNHSAIPVA